MVIPKLPVFSYNCHSYHGGCKYHVCGVIVDGASFLSFALNHTKTNHHVDFLYGALAFTLSLYSQLFLCPFYQLVRLKT